MLQNNIRVGMEKGSFLKVLEFLLYTLTIYACYITSGVYHQKILKHQYISDVDQSAANFDAPIVFTFFSQLLCAIIGWCLRQFLKRHYYQEPVHIPPKSIFICSLIINLSMLTYNKAVQAASFPAVVMVKSCSLLSVILVALFCSRVKEKELKLGMNKIWVGLVVTVGIFMFNYFKEREDSNNQPISWVSTFLLLVSLLGDGLLPDYQAQIKSSFKPGVIDMYYAINKYTCLISLAYATIFQQLVYISSFILEHSELQLDLLYYSVLNAVGQLVIYRLIKLFKQHIAPFVIATRKCFTVIVNILYFGHTINQKQGIGMILVFTAIMIEVYGNYKEKKSMEPVAVQLPTVDEDEGKDKVQIDSEHLRQNEEDPLAQGEENGQKMIPEEKYQYEEGQGLKQQR